MQLRSNFSLPICELRFATVDLINITMHNYCNLVLVHNTVLQLRLRLIIFLHEEKKDEGSKHFFTILQTIFPSYVKTNWTFFFLFLVCFFWTATTCTRRGQKSSRRGGVEEAKNGHQIGIWGCKLCLFGAAAWRRDETVEDDERRGRSGFTEDHKQRRCRRQSRRRDETTSRYGSALKTTPTSSSGPRHSHLAAAWVLMISYAFND